MGEIEWEWASFADMSLETLYAVLALRQRVFVVEQACPFLDADGLDPRAFHLMGRGHPGGALLAYARVFAAGAKGEGTLASIGRVCTEPSARGAGLGRRLMGEAVARCDAAFGPGPIQLWAQAQLQGFYGSMGFVVEGPGAEEDGILHVPMIMARR